MEKCINKKIAQHANEFKTNITNAIKLLNIDDNTKSDLLRYVFDYNVLQINKSDITKRKRAKNIVPLADRCCALRAAGEQCSRRKKEPNDFCGTHIKGTPHGIITDKPPKKTHKESRKQSDIESSMLVDHSLTYAPLEPFSIGNKIRAISHIGMHIRYIRTYPQYLLQKSRKVYMTALGPKPNRILDSLMSTFP